MAQIIEKSVVIKFSKLVKGSGDIDISEIKTQLEEIIEELVQDKSIIVEIE